MEIKWIGIRLMYSEKAFGTSGNLSSDIKVLCVKHNAAVFFTDNKGGFNYQAAKANKYLFGGSKGDVFNISEVIIEKKNRDSFLEEFKSICKKSKDNFGMYEFDIETFNFSE